MWSETFDLHYSPQDLLGFLQDQRHVFLLESSLFDKSRGRFSILGFDPFFVYQQKDRNNLAELKRQFDRYTKDAKRSSLPLTSGIVGYLGYDYGLLQEGIGLTAKDDLNIPDCIFGFYDCILTIDHARGKLIVTASGLPESSARFKELRAKQRLKMLRMKLAGLSHHPKKTVHHETVSAELTSNFTKKEYIRAVKRALNYINDGDIYQVNLSQRFSLESESASDSYQLYRSLIKLSPTSFGGFYQAGDFQIISSSPERFLRVREGAVHTCPMKGTRPRGQTKEEDNKYYREIKTSEKERAELLMITDLERNDLGRVCDYGSVRVKQMRAIERYQTVYQATSTIEGKLREGKGPFDLIKACFPGGSITGCPKIRSMEIIDELEPTRRGVYTGSLGYIDFNGDMDFNILIRTLVAAERNVYFQVGGGIVADSTPESEYEETLLKAKAMMDALKEVPRKKYDRTPALIYT